MEKVPTTRFATLRPHPPNPCGNLKRRIRIQWPSTAEFQSIMLDGHHLASPVRVPTVAQPTPITPHPTRAEAEAAVRTLIRWAGDEPSREGLRDTPARVVRAYEEWFAGYAQDPDTLLSRTFEDVDGYQEVVLLRDIPLHSTCEHHMAAITGTVDVAYLPNRRVVGISKLARVVEALGRRLQIQERLTAQIADSIERALQPRGIAVAVRASHGCMTTRGVRTHGACMVTRDLRGDFREEPRRAEILAMLAGRI